MIHTCAHAGTGTRTVRDILEPAQAVEDALVEDRSNRKGVRRRSVIVGGPGIYAPSKLAVRDDREAQVALQAHGLCDRCVLACAQLVGGARACGVCGAGAL